MSRRLSRHGVIAVLLICGYTALFSFLSFRKFRTFHTESWDTGIYDQILWGITHGFRRISLCNHEHFLSIHIQPLFYLLSLPYLVIPRPEAMLFLQAAALALGALPVYLLASKKSDASCGLLFACSYLLYPPISNINLFDFHPLAFAVPVLLFALYFFETGGFGKAMVFCVLACAVEETAALPAAMVGLRMALPHKKRAEGWLTFTGCMLWFLLCMFLIRPAFSGGELVQAYTFGSKGRTPYEVAAWVFNNPVEAAAGFFEYEKLRYIFLMLLPVCFLSLLAPAVLALCLPNIVISFMTEFFPAYSIDYHYSALLVPFVFVSAVLGAEKLSTGCLKNLSSPFRLLAIAVLAFSAGTHLIWSKSPFSLRFRDGHYRYSAKSRQGIQLLRMIPGDASVAATVGFTPHLSHRKDLVLLAPGNIPEKDCLLIDLSLQFPINVRTAAEKKNFQEKFAAALRAMAEEGYDVHEAEGVALMKRRK